MPGPMYLDPDGIYVNLRKILQEMREFPAAADVAVSEGGSSAVTGDFRDEVGAAAATMAAATETIVDSMNGMHDTIRSVVAQLVENDASLADDTNVLLALLDSAAQQTAEDTSAKSDYT